MIRDAIHCPSAPFNLVSVSRITDAGYRVIFRGNTVEIRSPRGALLAVGDKISHLYRLRIADSKPRTYALAARSWDDWH
ncbi:hypothetical protein EV122DRAFT_221278, partial [Schizophyllum commune]